MSENLMLELVRMVFDAAGKARAVAHIIDTDGTEEDAMRYLDQARNVCASFVAEYDARICEDR